MKSLNKTMNEVQSSLIVIPNQLASRILDLELEYDQKNLTRDSLMQLLSAYSQAIEFYQENRDKKYQIFQNRLNNVLKNPYVISILQGQSANKIKEQQINELTKTAETTSNFEANQLLSSFSNQKNKVQSKIGKQIQGQRDKLLRRVMNRSFNKSFSTNIQNKQRNDSINMPQQQELTKKQTKDFLSYLDDRKMYELPQRRKNIRAPNI